MADVLTGRAPCPGLNSATWPLLLGFELKGWHRHTHAWGGFFWCREAA